jgi:Zn-dependent protease
MLFIVGFGWARPVPIDYLRFRTFRLGLISVSLAGCLTNILIAIIAAYLLQFKAISANPAFPVILLILLRINIILGAFNLIPIPPLDGSRILTGLLPERAQQYLARLEPYGFFILVLLLFTGYLEPLITFIQNGIYSLIAVLLNLAGRG